MNSRITWQQFKNLLFVNGIFALVLAAPTVASANATIDIKDTKYPIPSGAYFVSPNGKDSNCGKTPDSPCSVKQALASAPNGSTIVFRGGTYRKVDTAIKKQLTLQAYPHEKPWIKGSIEVEGWEKEGSLWRKDGWTYSFTPLGNEGSEYIDPDYPMANYRDMVYVNGVSLKQVKSKAKVVPGTFYVDSAHKRLYIGENPADKMVEATVLNRGLTIWKGGSIDPSGTVVRGLGFAHYADQGIEVQAPEVTLENNSFVWNGVQGAAIWGDGKSTDAILRGNTFSYNGRKGLAGGHAHRMLLENNTFSYNNVERFATTWDAAGIKITSTDGLIWRNNLVENNFATGMWADVSVTNAIIVNNTVRNNKGIGIFFEISHKAIIAGNVIINSSAGIMIADSSNARAYNNTLSMNYKHIVVKDSTRKNTNAAEVAAGIAWVTRNNIFKNNILSNAKSSTILEAMECIGSQHSAQMITDSDYNGYYHKASSKSQKMIKWSKGKGKLVAYPSIVAFESATGYEANAIAVDNVANNPFFVNEENGDYRLKAGSSAIKRGQALPADIAKAIGLQPGVAVDLGAPQPNALSVK